MTSVGPLPGQTGPTRLNAVSDDGVAVGTSAVGLTSTGVPFNRAVRWSADDGLELLPMPTPEDEQNISTAQAITSDGRVFGKSLSGEWLYSDDTGFEFYPEEARNLGWLSSDGMFRAGSVSLPNDTAPNRAAYWSPATGRQILEPYLDNGETYGANGTSDDGSVIIGGQNNVGNLIWIDRGPPMIFEDYVTSLGVDLTGYLNLQVRAVSADGTTFVGQAGVPFVGNVAFAIVIPAPATGLGAGIGLLALRRRR